MPPSDPARPATTLDLRALPADALDDLSAALARSVEAHEPFMHGAMSDGEIDRASQRMLHESGSLYRLVRRLSSRPVPAPPAVPSIPGDLQALLDEQVAAIDAFNADIGSAAAETRYNRAAGAVEEWHRTHPAAAVEARGDDRAGSHLIDGEFQSDKYPTCPRGKVPLSVKDPTAQDLLWTYAQRRRSVDAQFSADLETALTSAGYRDIKPATPPPPGPLSDEALLSLWREHIGTPASPNGQRLLHTVANLAAAHERIVWASERAALLDDRAHAWRDDCRDTMLLGRLAELTGQRDFAHEKALTRDRLLSERAATIATLTARVEKAERDAGDCLAELDRVNAAKMARCLAAEADRDRLTAQVSALTARLAVPEGIEGLVDSLVRSAESRADGLRRPAGVVDDRTALLDAIAALNARAERAERGLPRLTAEQAHDLVEAMDNAVPSYAYVLIDASKTPGSARLSYSMDGKFTKVEPLYRKHEVRRFLASLPAQPAPTVDRAPDPAGTMTVGLTCPAWCATHSPLDMSGAMDGDRRYATQVCRAAGRCLSLASADHDPGTGTAVGE